MKKTITAALIALSVTTGAFAALSPKYADFAKGPAQFLLTKDEQAAWKNVRTDAEAQAFIDLFWARRDPTPATPENEFLEGYNQRVELADKRYAANKVKGSLTDRGKVFIAIGAPTNVQRTVSPGGTIQGPESGMPTDLNSATTASAQGNSPREVWTYEQQKTRIQLGTPEVELVFIDQYGTKEFKLERSGRTDHGAVFNHVAQSFVAQPDLKAVPTFTIPAAAIPVVAAPAPVAAGIVTPAIRAAVDAAAAEANGAQLSYGEFITAEGEHFVPVQLFVPKGSSVPADANVTFFGSVKGANGEVVAFEEEAMLAASKDDRFVAKSLTLAPGKYKGTFGLAVAGKPVSVVASDLEIAGLKKEDVGFSKLMLSNNVYPLETAQRPTDPFAFGGIKVVPKSDRLFRKSDELWYFFELRNPALDPATNLPKLTVALTVAGKTTEGKSVKMAAPSEETPARELKGVAGHYAVGASIPLATFKPGDYSITVKVKDLTTNQTYDLKETFKIVE
ncbi:MAG TPA: GWxTD domain-containing protein [Thermoanaerobaculia bacterium]|jgi:GWxTD domain-containing protein